MFSKISSTLLKSRLFAPILLGLISIFIIVFLILDNPKFNKNDNYQNVTTTSNTNVNNLESEKSYENLQTVPQNLSQTGEQNYYVTVSKNDSLSSIFNRLNISQVELLQALNSNKQNAKLFTKLKLDQKLTIETNNNKFTRIFSELSALESIELVKTEQGFKFNHTKAVPQIEELYAHGIINESLSESAKKLNLPNNLIFKLADIFAYDIDFTQDIRTGDEFELIYESKSHNDQNIGVGNIVAARFTVQGKSHTAIRYQNKKGIESYFDASGRAMRKQFLRNPVDFVRISSRFSLARKHPILNTIRAHRGIDYAAKTGTPIRATANGTVVFSDWQNGYGNVIKIQHSNKYRTVYAHLNKFNASAKKGAKVKQGQIIGYVGQTGLATAPHLHYEFQINGVHVDPLKHKVIALDPVPIANKSSFLQFSVPLIAKMDEGKARTLAMLK